MIQSMEERLLNVNDTAQMLGISPKTLYDWARERKVSSIKLFGSLRFKLSDIQKLIKKCERKAA